jgi:hypothetical protein
MPSAGDIDMAHDFFFLPVTKLATAAINKGDIVTLSAGRSFQDGDVGPYGIANQAIASGADMKGKVVIDGVVYVKTVGALSQFAMAMPASSTEVSGTTGVGDNALAGFWLGMAFDPSAGAGGFTRVHLRIT